MSEAEENKVEQPASPPVARIVATEAREKMVPLQWPVEFDGKLWTEIRVHRVTGKEVAAYFTKMKEGDSSAVAPMVDCPQEVWDAMDDDDQDVVDTAARPFWPRRLIAAYGLGQELGEDTSD